MLTNWLEGRNPFKLAAPSPWWLQLLLDYDPQLVVMPSTREHAYRLCRRVPRARRLGLNHLYHHGHPDTVQMIQHGLVPVSTLTTWSVSSDKIIRDLMARDTWRHGGAAKVSAQLESQEEQATLAQRARTQQGLLEAGGDAFRSLQYRTGTRVSLAQPTSSIERMDRALAGPTDKSVSSPRPVPLASFAPRITLVTS